jgi:1-acyl-sn-glycerol-3-phosphate acyltransferase
VDSTKLGLCCNRADFTTRAAATPAGTVAAGQQGIGKGRDSFQQPDNLGGCMSATSATSNRDPLRPLRYVYRVPLLFLHVLLAVPLALCTQNTLFARMGGADPLDQRMVRWWTTVLLRIFGLRVRRYGQPLPDPVMFVANHVSWLDIELVHTQRAVCFVAKAEIARWPLIGWLASRGGTIFHRRGSNDSLARVMAVMVERLRAGRAVAAFPEGGTGNARELRTFHARIFQAALDADAPLQPVALRYSRDGDAWPGVAFAPGESFFANAWRRAGEPTLDAEVHFLEPLSERDSGRKRLAEQARTRIGAALGMD